MTYYILMRSELIEQVLPQTEAIKALQENGRHPEA